MDTEKLNSIYIPHIKSQIQAGNVILFTGAGFSLGSKNINDEISPLANDIKLLYWNLLYGESELDESCTLTDIYDVCLKKNRKELTNLTRDKLTIQSNSLENWYRTYFEIPWLLAFTLNIDNLEEVANNQFNLSRRCESISATTKPVSVLNESDPKKLKFVHLNGCLADIPDNITFSTIQYASRFGDQDPWKLNISINLLSRSVIFIGTALSEPSLWYYLSQRRQKGGKSQSELRPRSYLVTPKLPEPRKSLLNDFNIVHIPMTAEQFSRDVLSKIPNSVFAEGEKKLPRQNNPTDSRPVPIDLSKVEIKPNSRTDFLLGEQPVWSDITDGRAIKTNFDEKLEATVNNEICKDQPKHILITGPAGSGKTTSVMRLGFKLQAEGKKVFWIDRNLEISPHQILDFVLSEENIDVLLIDDSDLYGSRLSDIVIETRKSRSYPLICFEMRSISVDHCFNQIQPRRLKPKELVVPRLSNRDITRLISALDADNKLGHLKGKTTAEQIAAFRDNNRANRELVVAMYEATTGLAFRKKVVEELNQLKSPAKTIYSIVAVANSRRFNLSKDELLLAINDVSNEVFNEINRLLKRRILINLSNNEITSRHRVISDFILNDLHIKGMMSPILTGLLRMAAIKTEEYNSNSSKHARMIKAFINHDFIYKMLDLNQAQNLYADLEDYLSFSHHFWLHRGALEVEYGSLNHAENYLAQARGLAESDPLVRNEWAYLLFRKANMNPTTLEAPRLADEAEKILIELIYENKVHPHPYHVLGNQGLQWVSEGIYNRQEKVKYLEKLRKYLKKGLYEFPTNSRITNISDEVKRTYLSLAIQR